MKAIFESSLSPASRNKASAAIAAIEREIEQFKSDYPAIIAQNLFFGIKKDVAVRLHDTSEAKGYPTLVYGRYLDKDKKYLIKSVCDNTELNLNQLIPLGLPKGVEAEKKEESAPAPEKKTEAPAAAVTTATVAPPPAPAVTEAPKKAAKKAPKKAAKK